MAKFALGLDGGGTSTSAVLLDSCGSVVGNGIAGSSNRNSVGQQVALAALRQAIDAALAAAHASIHQVGACCAALSGVDTPQDAAELLAALRPLFAPDCRLEVHNDAVAALCAGTGGVLDGVVLIAGTGTVAYGVRPDGQSARAAGWGGAFLDGGSGYDIGQRALAAAARAVDGRGPLTALLQAICAACGVGSNTDAMEGLLRFAYPASSSGDGDGVWARIGALATCVEEAAATGDAVANSILDDAAAELVGSLEAVFRRLELGSGAAGGIGSCQTSPITVVLAGGLLQPGSAMSQRVAGLCAQRLSCCRIVHASNPAIGAANLARQWLHDGSM